MLSEEVKALLNRHRERCNAKAREIEREFGSIAEFRKRLVVSSIESQDDPRLVAFYELYSKNFVLEDEREPIEGFQKVLSFNGQRSVQEEFGPFMEPIWIVKEPTRGEIIAAANFALFSYSGASQLNGWDASCQLHFLLVREDLRGLGLAGLLLRDLELKVEEFARLHGAGASPAVFLTCEQNAPDKMTAEQIEADAKSALIDPRERYRWWRSRGFRRLGFSYVQPPLSPEHSPCSYLDYYARLGAARSAETSLDTACLLEHLRRFFFVSVGKLDIDMDHNAEWASIRAELSRVDRIPLI